jgi:hypothetical protein
MVRRNVRISNEVIVEIEFRELPERRCGVFPHFVDNFSTRGQIVILGEVGENIVAVFPRYPLSPLSEGLFGNICPERVAIGIFLPRHLSLAREKPVDKDSRGIGVGRAVDENDGSGARALIRL